MLIMLDNFKPFIEIGGQVNYNDCRKVMIMEIPYGSTMLQLNLPVSWQVDWIAPPVLGNFQPAASLIEAALENEIDANLSALAARAKSAAIAINDKTRPVPNDLLLPPLLARLENAGIKPENITLLVATGSHLPMKPREFPLILPHEILARYPVVSHDCDDEHRLTYCGRTSSGTEVWANSLYQAADLRIVCGNLEPHHFMGYSGGVKSAAIGLTGRKTINQNHHFLLDPASKIGAYETNPTRVDVEEIGELMGIHYALNAIMSPDKVVCSAVAGHPKAIMKSGISLANKLSMAPVSKRYDLVIASAGGYPKDINLYQAQKGLTNAASITRDGGKTILVAECRDGVGSQSYLDFMKDLSSYDDVLDKFASLGFQVGPHKAVQFGLIAKRIRVCLVSNLPLETTNRLLLTGFADISSAVASCMTASEQSGVRSVAVMPFASTTVPDLEGNR